MGEGKPVALKRHSFKSLVDLQTEVEKRILFRAPAVSGLGRRKCLRSALSVLGAPAKTPRCRPTGVAAWGTAAGRRRNWPRRPKQDRGAEGSHRGRLQQHDENARSSAPVPPPASPISKPWPARAPDAATSTANPWRRQARSNAHGRRRTAWCPPYA